MGKSLNWTRQNKDNRAVGKGFERYDSETWGSRWLAKYDEAQKERQQKKKRKAKTR